MPPAEFNPVKKSNHKLLWLVFVLVVIIGAAFWAVTILNTKEIPLDLIKGKPIINNTLPEGYKYVATGAGEYPAGFPKELVLFTDAKILRGENTTDGAGVNHKIIEYSIAESAADVASQYQSKLPPLKWKLSGQPIIQNGLQMLNFTKDKMTLSIIISSRTTTFSQVSLDVVGAPDVKSEAVQKTKPVLPKDFPAEFFIDKEAQLVLVEKIGATSNVIFLSKITQDEFLTKLVSSLKLAKWEIVSQKQDASTHKLFATKGNKTINFYSFKLSNNYTEAHYEYAQ